MRVCVSGWGLMSELVGLAGAVRDGMLDDVVGDVCAGRLVVR